jgi:head-tail adaptor
MQAGKLRHKIAIARPIRGESPLSGETTVEGWEHLGYVHAEIKPRSAFRREQSAQMQASATHDISMRYTPIAAVLPFRLNFKDRIFRVVGSPINVDELDIEIRLSVVEET